MLIVVVNSKEGRDIATVDALVACLNVNVKDLVYVKIEGELADIILKIDKIFEKHVIVENGRKILFLIVIVPLSV